MAGVSCLGPYRRFTSAPSSMAALTVGQESLHGLCDLQVRGDVVGAREVPDGDVGGAALRERREHRAVADFEERVGARRRRGCPSSSATAPAPRRARRGARASRRRRRRRCASSFDTTGAVGVANVTWPARRRDRRAASCMSGVWNAPPTLSGVARRTPSSLARADAASRPSGVPAITTWPGALSLATQHAVGRGGARVLGLLERSRRAARPCGRGARRPRPG